MKKEYVLIKLLFLTTKYYLTTTTNRVKSTTIKIINKKSKLR